MPTYTFRNKETLEEVELVMKIAERDVYEKDHPEMEQVLKSMKIVDPVGIGVTKPPAEFQKMVLGRIQERTPGATAIANRRWGVPREW